MIAESIKNKTFNPNIYSSNLQQINEEIKWYPSKYPATLNFFATPDEFIRKLNTKQVDNYNRIMSKIFDGISTRKIKNDVELLDVTTTIEYLIKKVINNIKPETKKENIKALNINRLVEEVKEYPKYYPNILKLFKNRTSFNKISSKLNSEAKKSLDRILDKINKELSIKKITTSYDIVEMIGNIELLSGKIIQTALKS